MRAQSKCHTKGIVVDSGRVCSGSHNWTNQGTLVNRDASLIFFDEEVAQYYERAFLFDWDHLAKARLSEDLPAPELLAPGTEAPLDMAVVSLRDLLEG